MKKMFKIVVMFLLREDIRKAVEDALWAGGNTFQYFTRNPRGGSSKELNHKDTEDFKRIYKKINFILYLPILHIL